MPERGELAWFGPVDQELTEIGERVPEGAQLPIEHGQHVAVASDDAVVEAVVAVNHARRIPGRGCGPPADRGPSRRPPGSRRPGTRARPGSCRTSAGAGGRCTALCGPGPRDRPRRGQRRGSGPTYRSDPAPTGTSPRASRSASTSASLRAMIAVDEAHYVEGGVVDRIVGTQSERGGNGHPGRAQGRNDSVLAAHVVGLRQTRGWWGAGVARNECRRRRALRRSGCCDRRRRGGTAVGPPLRECWQRTRR